MRPAKKRAAAHVFTGSMVNVAFLLTICFMLSVAFAARGGLEVALVEREGGSDAVAGPAPVLVEVRADGSYLVDGKPLRIDRFADYLKTRVDPGSRPPVLSRPVVVRSDGEASYGALVDAIDELRQAQRRLGLGARLDVAFAGERATAGGSGGGAAPAAAPPSRAAPVRTGPGTLPEPSRIHDVPPVYPETARRARLEGEVVLEIVVDRQGNVRSWEVLRSLPLGLTEAAIDAVKQWRYEPSVYNGRPVEVLITVNVRFTLR